jgi:hypothetical protein
MSSSHAPKTKFMKKNNRECCRIFRGLFYFLTDQARRVIPADKKTGEAFFL